MPPKKAKAPEVSKKTEAKKKDKIIEDKTFGLKNKKGAKTQKFIQHVQNQVKHGGQAPKKAEVPTTNKKEEKKKELEEMNQIFKPVTIQKVEKGVDPKSVLCAFFKQGQCAKGDKCKFSHDLTLDRKSEKKSFYVDIRNDGTEDTMENWGEEKLKEVVAKKHGEKEKKMPTTDIICKHFLEALETNKYGWFWDCPNGGDKCHYRHALPPGFVLNKDRKKNDKKDDITIEELVEIERAKLGIDLIRITLESFLEWKRKKIKEKQDKDEKEIDRKRAEFKAGKNIGLSGREMFTFNPELAIEEDIEEGEEALGSFEREDEEEEFCKEVTIEALLNQAEKSDGSGTHFTKRQFDLPLCENTQIIACGGADDNHIDSAPIDEALFDVDVDDIDDLDVDLNNLQVQ